MGAGNGALGCAAAVETEVTLTASSTARGETFMAAAAFSRALPAPSGKFARTPQREFPRLCEQAGIAGFTFHSLRHTFAALLVKAGVPMIEVRDALGHSSIVMTERAEGLRPAPHMYLTPAT